MKTALLSIGAILLVLLITNPKLPAHRSAYIEKGLEGLNAAQYAGLKRNLPHAFIESQIAEEVDKRLSRTNVGLFSLTKSTTYQVMNRETGKPYNRFIGIGILGQVYIWGDY